MAFSGSSGKYIPRGARTDPKPWALDEELTQALEERRRATTAVQEVPSPENQAIWKEKKRITADAEVSTRQRSFRLYRIEQTGSARAGDQDAA